MSDTDAREHVDSRTCWCRPDLYVYGWDRAMEQPSALMRMGHDPGGEWQDVLIHYGKPSEGAT